MKTKLVLLVCASIGLAACGKEEEQPARTVRLKSSLSTEERERLCIVDATPEEDAAKTAFVESIGGVWTHYPRDASDGYARKELHFKPNDRTVAVTTYYSSWQKDVENMAWTKLCLSTPLDSSHGALGGFRLLEIVADNGGGAAALFRLDDGKLTMSSYHYVRQASDELMPLSEAVALDSLRTLWQYPNKQ